MCRNATLVSTAAGLAFLAGTMFAQGVSRPDGRAVEWRHLGSSAVELGLPSLATGPVSRVWYSADGTRLFALTATGRIFETSDFEQWGSPDGNIASVWPGPGIEAISRVLPEPGARVRAGARAGRLYSFGNQIYRSDDGGATWNNLTQYRGRSILAAEITDLAVAPGNPDDVTASNAFGVWRSLDGGLSWTGLNSFLPNLGIRRLLATPSGSHGAVAVPAGDSSTVYEWAPGEKTAWRPVPLPENFARELALRKQLSQNLSARITAVAVAGDYEYAGSADGRIWSSADQGRTWRISGNADEAGAVESIFVDGRNPNIALATLGISPQAVPANRPVHVRRTQNAGAFWDDITANLPDIPAHGVTADVPSGAIYVATSAGVFYTFTDLLTAGAATAWLPLGGNLPAAGANDVRLDANDNQLWTVIEGYGVYSTLAPHRFRNIAVVSAADHNPRPAAPGSLLSVLGAKLESAQSANTSVPVFAASDTASQIQVPFSASGSTLPLTLQSAARRYQQNVPLLPVSPAIFVDPDGAPMLLDAESGLLLDTSQPVPAGTRIQIFATGLGRVQPNWPTGLPAPLQDPPKVTAAVHAFLDGQSLTVSQAVLAPSYVGFYLVELELPRIVNAGQSELYIEADGQISNRVRILIAP